MATGKETASLTVGGLPLLSFCISADGKRMATNHQSPASNSGCDRVVVWDVATRKPLFDQKLTSFETALSPDGKTLAGRQAAKCGSGISRMQRNGRSRGLSNFVYHLAFAPSNTSFAAVSADPLSGVLLKADLDDAGAAFMMSLIEGMLEKPPAQLQVWDMPLPEIGSPLPLDNKTITDFAGPNGRIAIGREESVEIWDANRRMMERRIAVPKGGAAAIALAGRTPLFSPHGKDKLTKCLGRRQRKTFAARFETAAEITVLSRSRTAKPSPLVRVVMEPSGYGITSWGPKKPSLRVVSG